MIISVSEPTRRFQVPRPNAVQHAKVPFAARQRLFRAKSTAKNPRACPDTAQRKRGKRIAFKHATFGRVFGCHRQIKRNKTRLTALLSREADTPEGFEEFEAKSSAMNQRPTHMPWDVDKKKPAKSDTLRMRAEIGRQIRAMYDEVTNEGVPNRFQDLLTRLDTNRSSA